jgi:hypothetical protein
MDRIVAWSFISVHRYPSRPITIIVPFPAGGAPDVLGRNLAESMRSSLGQTIIIENVAGASGSLGVGRVAASQETAPPGRARFARHCERQQSNDDAGHARSHQNGNVLFAIHRIADWRSLNWAR